MGTKALQKQSFSLFDIAAEWIPLLEAWIAAETDPELSDERPVCLMCGGRGDDGIPPAEVGDRGVAATGPCDSCGGSGRSASERERAIEAAELALAAHSSKEVEKADSYIGLIGYLEAAIVTRKAERDRQARTAGVLERILSQVKASAVCAITAVPGRTRVDGARGYLLAKKNGSLAPLLVADPAMVPDDLCKLEGWINAGVFARMVELVRRYSKQDNWQPAAKLSRVVDNTAVRAKLAEPCPTCGGKIFPPPKVCEACGGSGTAGVPGARLGERGVHLEVK